MFRIESKFTILLSRVHMAFLSDILQDWKNDLLT